VASTDLAGTRTIGQTPSLNLFSEEDRPCRMPGQKYLPDL